MDYFYNELKVETTEANLNGYWCTCRPLEMGTRRSAPPRSISRGAFTCWNQQSFFFFRKKKSAKFSEPFWVANHLISLVHLFLRTMTWSVRTFLFCSLNEGENRNAPSKYGQSVISDRRGEDDQVKEIQRHVASLHSHRPLHNTNLECQWCQSSVIGCRLDYEQLPP